MNVYYRLGAFDPNKDYSGKYCLSFRFGRDDYGIPHAHVTHKYLGAISDLKLEVIRSAIDVYWSKNRELVAQPRIWCFDQHEMFGEEKDTPVLLRNELEGYDGMLVRLKHMLDAIVEDTWPYYRPHITVPATFDRKAVYLRPVEYALTSGKTLLNSWPIGHEARREVHMSKKMRTLSGEMKPGAAQKPFGDRVKEELDKKKSLSDETTETNEGGAESASGGGVVQEVVAEPTMKTMAEMLQSPKEILESESASGGLGTQEAASGGAATDDPKEHEDDTSASGGLDPAKKKEDKGDDDAVDQEVMTKMRASINRDYSNF